MLGNLFRFGIVGLVATLVHILTGMFFILGGFEPEQANFVAFLIAFFVSFSGHYGFSFPETELPFWHSAGRFGLVALLGFLFNQSVLILLTGSGAVQPLLALTISTGLAAFVVFFLSQFWAFSKPKRTASNVGGNGEDN